MRNNRADNQLREVAFELNVNKHAEGSCIIKMGDTHVLCTASVEERVPPFLRNTNSGWITAEYNMLPRSTHDRIQRDSSKGKVGGRTHEIQRLIGRSLRSAVDLKLLGERQIFIDCDVLQADGGTRTASITGGFVALCLAIKKLCIAKVIKKNPIKHQVAAISCGIVNNKVLLDLDYIEDSNACVDANFVMTESNHLIEVQGTAENEPFSTEQMQSMLSLAQNGIKQLIEMQQSSLGL